MALSELGGQCVFASEIDPNCREVYRDNFGFEPAGDIRPLTEGELVMVPDHDVLCAGFPCQPFSKSGNQLGMDETRGTLFFNILRVLEARRPRFVILENVRNLAGPKQKPIWETISLNLRRLGYQVSDRPTVFSPHLLNRTRDGRPQIRERVFILAEYMGDDWEWADREPLVANKPVDSWNPADWRIEDWLQNDDEIEHIGKYVLSQNEINWLDAWNVFIQRLAENEELPGFPIWAKEFRARARVFPWTPSWKANFLEKNAALYRRNRTWIIEWKKEFKVDSFPESRQKFEWQARGSEPDLWQLVMHMRPSGIRVKAPTYLPALVAINQTSIIGSRRRRITPREAARLQGLPDSFLLHRTDAVAYKQLGNGVSVGVVKHVARALFDSSSIGWPGCSDEKALISQVS
ncbi:MAG: DNA (cytosine-5-)-methyltransferase [Acidimicrobiales bacterium]